MSGVRKRNLEALNRRRNWLAARIATRQGDPDYNRAELRALNYAIAVIEEAHRRGLLDELVHVRVAP